ncbi:MAG TPA: RNA polymerase factor sigma-54 [Chloroflexota bacterium]|nr:RNA polymerase factor sigma-54 [Chloroflexota bacterium]
MDMLQQEFQDMRQTVSPRMVQASSILAMSSTALQQAISQEAQENPALEVDEVSICPRCGDKLEGSICLTCGEGTAERDPTEQFLEEEAFRQPAQLEEDEFDPLTVVAAEVTLAERLLQDLGAMLDPEDMPIAEYLVGALDETGYLRTSIDEVVWHFQAAYETVERVLEALQSLDPPGVGARDIRECMLIQVKRLSEAGEDVNPLVEPIIRDHLEEIGKHRFQVVARHLRVPVTRVEKAWEFIKSQLSPYPAYMFEDRLPVGRSSRTQSGQAITPDIVVTIDSKGDLKAEVIESKRYQLRVSRPYESVLRQVRVSSGALTEEEREHVRAYVQRARQFINSIQQRRRTMQLLADFLIERQGDFLKQGIRHLRPLTRAETAAAVGVHESTVSRAAAEKFVLVPSGKVVPLSDFFKAALPVQDVMREIIEHEGGLHLTDREISDLLAQRGYQVARRTVAKYRSQMRILPSELRT